MVRTPLLAGAVSLTLLLGWAAWESRWTADRVSMPSPQADQDTQAATAPTLPPLRVAPLSDYRATLERPLFFSSRRPEPQGAGPAEGSGTSAATSRGAAGRLTLSAVIIEGDARSALLTRAGEVTSARIREGESLDGWRLVTVEEDGVVVESAGQRQRLSLRTFGAAPKPRITDENHDAEDEVPLRRPRLSSGARRIPRR